MFGEHISQPGNNYLKSESVPVSMTSMLRLVKQTLTKDVTYYPPTMDFLRWACMALSPLQDHHKASLHLSYLHLNYLLGHSLPLLHLLSQSLLIVHPYIFHVTSTPYQNSSMLPDPLSHFPLQQPHHPHPSFPIWSCLST